MIRKNEAGLASMGYALSILLAVCAGAGIFIPGFYEPWLERYGLTFSQVFVQDVMALALAPVLAAAIAKARRGSYPALVLWAGISLFSAYYFSFYGMDKLATPLYPAYLAIVGLGFYSLMGLLSAVDPSAAAARVPRRAAPRFGAVVLGMTGLFVPLWMVLIVRMIRTAVVEPAATVFLLDLSFLIPAALYAAGKLWRRRPEGWFLGSVLLFKSFVSGILLSGGTLWDAIAGRAWDPAQLGMYLFLAGAGGAAFLSLTAGSGAAGSPADGGRDTVPAVR